MHALECDCWSLRTEVLRICVKTNQKYTVDHADVLKAAFKSGQVKIACICTSQRELQRCFDQHVHFTGTQARMHNAPVVKEPPQPAAQCTFDTGFVVCVLSGKAQAHVTHRSFPITKKGHSHSLAEVTSILHGHVSAQVFWQPLIQQQTVGVLGGQSFCRHIQGNPKLSEP